MTYKRKEQLSDDIPMKSAGYIYSGQCELFGERQAVGFGVLDFFVKEISREAANKMIINNHYSGKIYAATYIHLGVFLNGEIVGVLQYGYAMNPASQSSIASNTEMDEYLELNRMWLDDTAPKNSESRAISYSIKFIRARHKKIKWIQSFADERCRLGGVVYQACNFKYYGEHDSIFWILDGVVYHNSLMTRNPALSKAAAKLQRSKNMAVAKKYRQFRYLFFMQPRFEKFALLTEQTFPKIAASPEDEQGTILCEAGVTPVGRSITGGA